MPSHEESPSRLEVLRNCQLLQALSEEERATLVAGARMVWIEKGTHLWTAGAQPEYFAVIASGYIKLSRIMPGGQEVTSDIMGPGHVLGLLSALQSMPVSLSATALTYGWTLKVLSKDFLPIFASNSAMKDHLLRRQTERLRRCIDMNAHRVVSTVAQRVATVLLELAESFGVSRGDTVIIEIPLTRREISEIAGTSVESAIRTMSRWQKSGIIASGSREIEIRDLEALKSVVSSGA